MTLRGQQITGPLTACYCNQSWLAHSHAMWSQGVCEGVRITLGLRWAAATETAWPTELKLFTVWPFTEKCLPDHCCIASQIPVAGFRPPHELGLIKPTEILESMRIPGGSFLKMQIPWPYSQRLWFSMAVTLTSSRGNSDAGGPQIVFWKNTALPDDSGIPGKPIGHSAALPSGGTRPCLF